MQTVYKQELSATLDALKEKYIAIVVACCKKFPDETLHFGNTFIKLEYDVPMFATGWEKPSLYVEMFGDDGYPQLTEIAHWADVCEDYVKNVEAGNSSYSTTWNI